MPAVVLAVVVRVLMNVAVAADAAAVRTVQAVALVHVPANVR